MAYIHIKDNKETMYVPINKLGSTSFVDQLLQINADDKKKKKRTDAQLNQKSKQKNILHSMQFR